MFGIAEYLIFKDRAFRNQGANRRTGIGLTRYGLGLVVALHQVTALVFMWICGLKFGAMLILFICMMSLLLQTFNNAKLFFIFVSPYALAAVAGAAQLIFLSFRQGRPFNSLAVVGSAALLLYFLRLARRQLSAAEATLRDAEHRAEERGEAAERANQAKSEFLASISHEIRTPLNGVIGMAQAMEHDPLPPQQRDRVRVIRESGQSLLLILNDVLDLSKIEARQVTLEHIAFSLKDVAQSACSSFTSLAEAKGLALSVSIADEVAGRYVGDPTRVRQIVHNLVSNALKFTEMGEVKLSCEGDGDRLRLSVRDTGIGIAPDKAEALFEKFAQADTSITRKFGGTGLGLSICRELCSLMGGSISVSSAPGQGSTFTAILPLRRIGPDVDWTDDAIAVKDFASSKGHDATTRILVAEDNPTNQLVVATLLTQAGLTALFVDNGRKAVSAWEDGEWDVILMDVQMPEMDGIAATGIIRAGESETGRRRTPIIALTANAMAHQVATYLSNGVDACVAKPIMVQALFAALDAALAGSEGI